MTFYDVTQINFYEESKIILILYPIFCHQRFCEFREFEQLKKFFRWIPSVAMFKYGRNFLIVFGVLIITSLVWSARWKILFWTNKIQQKRNLKRDRAKNKVYFLGKKKMFKNVLRVSWNFSDVIFTWSVW